MKGAFGEELKPVKISRFKVGDKFKIKDVVGVVTKRYDFFIEIVSETGDYFWPTIRTDSRRGEYVDLGRGLYAKDKINKEEI